LKRYPNIFRFGSFYGGGSEIGVDPDDVLNRLGGKMEVRSGESIAQFMSQIEPGQTISLAPDVWEYNDTLVIDKSCALIGHPLGTKIRRGPGLNGPLVSIEADNVVLSNIFFEDETTTSPIIGVQVTSNNVFISQCAIRGFTYGIYNNGGSYHQYLGNTIQASATGINLVATSAGHSIVGNSVNMTPATALSISLGESVSGSAVSGNVCSLASPDIGIKFYNTGAAQTFAAVGGSGNHVSGNVAVLQEVT
jgi:nitrous oxidase accessory protein NosD